MCYSQKIVVLLSLMGAYLSKILSFVKSKCNGNVETMDVINLIIDIFYISQIDRTRGKQNS